MSFVTFGKQDQEEQTTGPGSVIGKAIHVLHLSQRNELSQGTRICRFGIEQK